MEKLVKAVFFVFNLSAIMGLFFIVVAPREAFSQQVKTTIDIKYSLIEENDADKITTQRELSQKYVIDYQTSLGYFYDFTGKVDVDQEVKKKTDLATERKLSPVLDLKLKSDSLELTGSYSGDRSFKGGTEDVSSSTAYTNKYLFDAKLKPKNLPETTLKWERKRDFEKQTVERVSNKVDLELKYDFKDFGAEFIYSRSKDTNILPETLTTNEVTWEGNLDYERNIFKNLNLQLEYNIKENMSEDFGRKGIFEYRDKDYSQTLDAKLKDDFEILNNYNVSVAYDFTFEQDFMEEEFDYEMSHKISGDIEKDLMRWMKIKLKYEGTNEQTNNPSGEDDEEKVNNKVTGTIRMTPFTWIDIQTKAEREYETEIEAETGRSVGKTDDRRYETTVKTNYGNSLKLTGTHGYEEKFTDGFLKNKETQYKFKGTYQPLDSFKVEPKYEISLENTYDIEGSRQSFYSTTRTWDSEIKFSFDKKWLEVFQVKADHTFGYKKKQELDAALNLEEEFDLKEESKFSIRVQDWIRGMTLEAEVSRKANDTLDDDEPMIVDRTLSLKFEWNIGSFRISSSYKFDEKGDADDTLKFDTKLTWKKEFYEISGQYQFDKTFSEEIDEDNQYDIQLKLIF